MGCGCTKQNPDSVSNPIDVKRAKQSSQQIKIGQQNEDLISIVSLKSRQSIKMKENIGFYLVQGVRKLEKDNKKVTNQWKKTLSQYEKERQKEIRTEKIFTKKTDNVLLSFKKNKFSEFQSLIESGIPLNLRWNVWKVQLFNQDIYDEQLYEKLLSQPISEHYEIAILKDLPRTFPLHPYFQNKEIGGGGFLKLNQLNHGQRQLYNVLKALSIHMPNIGYTQGMNFVVGFLLMMSAGNENESFWVFLLLARDPNFLFMGLFEETLPLMHILISIFERKFRQVLSELYDHFQNILLDSMMWVWKWFITVYLYSFPIEIVAKLWDYIIINGGLSTISLGLALSEYYQKEFLKLDIEDIQILLRDMKDTDMLLDKNSKYYLDFTKLQKFAKKYTITSDFASKCISDFVNEKNSDNMYTKFYIMRSKDEQEATRWINNSIKERVKLTAAETVLHKGSIIQKLKTINIVPHQNIEESITNLIYKIERPHANTSIPLVNQPITNQIYSEGLSFHNNSNAFNHNLINQQDQNTQMTGLGQNEYKNNDIPNNKIINQEKILSQSSMYSHLKQSNLQSNGQSDIDKNYDENDGQQAIKQNPQKKQDDQENKQQQQLSQEKGKQIKINNQNQTHKQLSQQSLNKNNQELIDPNHQNVNQKDAYRVQNLRCENDMIRFTTLSEIQEDAPDHLTNVDYQNKHQINYKSQTSSNQLHLHKLNQLNLI